MTRYLKAVGLALAAVFALGAMSASAALAQQGLLTTSDGKPATLLGVETGAAGSNAFTSFNAKTECAGAYIGHKFNVTPHTPLANKETTVTISPSYKNCDAFDPATHPLTMNMNGCDWVLHIGVTTGGIAGTYGATLDIVCPVGKSIEKHVYNDVAHTQSLCTIKIKGQTGLAGAHVTNTGGAFDLVGSIQNIHVTREGLCVFDGQGTTTTTGQLHVDLSFKSTTAGQNISITE
jgi:hypothetical protein